MYKNTPSSLLSPRPAGAVHLLDFSEKISKGLAV
jgi:hypothetical protein